MFDVIIIGLGCAGYTAAIYTARYKLTTLIVGAEDGGMGLTAAEVGNWPGIIDIKGPDLMENFKKHAMSFEEVTHKIAKVTEVEGNPSMSLRAGGKGKGFIITFENGETAEGKTVILATGSSKRKLGVPGEKEFSGKGVTYCATCDAFFYKGKDVAVIGGGDSAVEGAAIAAQVAKKVYLVHRRKEFRAEPYWVDRVNARDNVVFVLERNLQEILGEGKVTGIKLDQPLDPTNPGSDMIKVDGVFIEIGSIPSVELAQQLGCELDSRGFLKVTPDQHTNIPGVFAAGDNTNESNYFAQFTTAAGEGAVAANGVFNYLSTVGAEGYMSAGS
ncbi:MAG: thioredoxin reductase (NADPH) [Candidatus Peregrinibacteria bacterium Greene0416_19]|nr:MAG: thioredoxin reductase (NADPH) [Candidatus Peregrinibacteria bacterium Greene0416_19]